MGVVEVILVGVEVGMSTAVAAALVVGDSCSQPWCRGSSSESGDAQSVPRVPSRPALVPHSRFPQRWCLHWTFRSAELSYLACSYDRVYRDVHSRGRLSVFHATSEVQAAVAGAVLLSPRMWFSLRALSFSLAY